MRELVDPGLEHLVVVGRDQDPVADIEAGSGLLAEHDLDRAVGLVVQVVVDALAPELEILRQRFDLLRIEPGVIGDLDVEPRCGAGGRDEEAKGQAAPRRLRRAA
jgi:hypothetical protein